MVRRHFESVYEGLRPNGLVNVSVENPTSRVSPQDGSFIASPAPKLFSFAAFNYAHCPPIWKDGRGNEDGKMGLNLKSKQKSSRS